MDHATEHRRALIDSAAGNSLELKRIKAKQKMGDRLICHPEYRFLPHHNPAHMGSAVLSMFLHLSGAIASGRV